MVASLPVGEPRFNDGIVDAHGRFWVGTQANPREPVAALYSLEVDGELRLQLEGVTVSNGICFGPAGDEMYFVDTLPHRSVDRFVVRNGRLTDRERIYTFAGNPDGMAIDVKGNLWVAVWDSSEVVHLSPEGVLLERIELPARRPTAVCLVRDRLIVTTARIGLKHPTRADGALLAIKVDVPGEPTPAAALM